MASEIEQAVGEKVNMVRGEYGTFDVIVNGKTIFSVAKEQRFPREGEIAALIKKEKKE